MDEELNNVLKSWGLSEEGIAAFTREKITTVNHLKSITLEDVSGIISIGDKIILRNNLAVYQASSTTTLDVEVIHMEQLPNVTLNIEPVATETDSQTKTPSPIKKRTEVRCSPRKNNPNSSTAAAPVRKIALCCSLFNNQKTPLENFNQLLESSSKGEGILSDYKTNATLSETSRRRLVQILVSNELDANASKKIESAKFKAMAKLIVEKFPSEVEDEYYFPFHQEGKKRVQAGGRLYTYYTNERKHLIDVNALPKKASSAVSSLAEVTKNKEKSFDWLQKSKEDDAFPVALGHWKNTYEERMQLLASNLSIVDYCKLFQPLHKNFGKDLFIADFDKIHPKKDRIFEEWPSFREQLITYIEDRKVKDSKFRAILAEVELADLPEDDDLLNIAVFKILAILLPQKTIKGKKKTWKPKTKSELLNYVFLIVSSTAELENAVDAKIEAFAPLGLTVQPFPAAIIVPGQPIQAYACVNKIFYRVGSPLSAIDVAFKICFALNADFPLEAKFVYLYLQKFVYDISTTGDSRYPTINTFHRALTAFGKKAAPSEAAPVEATPAEAGASGVVRMEESDPTDT